MSNTDSLPATRSSLLERVRDPQDHVSWGEFHSQYKRVAHQACVKAGLAPQDAEDVAAEAMAAVAAAMPDFQLDRSKGSFRGWLHRITLNKASDHWRRKYREQAAMVDSPSSLEAASAPELAEGQLTKAWNEEWEKHLLERALERAKDKVSSRNYQIFHLSAVKGWSVEELQRNLGLGRTTIYLGRYRVGLVVKKEIARLRKELD
jgi:RNA polymerase sigma factor (sigma-70 family)